jgi:hypothetical protein
MVGLTLTIAFKFLSGRFTLYNNLIGCPFSIYQLKTMSPMPVHQPHPVLQAVRNLLNRFTQSPNIYPIKFYKKSERLKKHRKMYMVK